MNISFLYYFIVFFSRLAYGVMLISKDSKLDDGDITAGRITASVAACVPNGANDPVPILDIAI